MRRLFDHSDDLRKRGFRADLFRENFDEAALDDIRARHRVPFPDLDGILSPVIAARSIKAWPSAIFPSTGI